MADPYEIIAERFEELFPCPTGAMPFIVNALRVRTDVGEQTLDARPTGKGTGNRARVLDTGCATGELDRGLAHAGLDVDAIDTSEAMIDRARAKWDEADAAGTIRFDVMDMRTIDAAFQPASFDAVLCLGNTLPHLENVDQIQNAMASMARLLRPDGSLVLQLLDYEGVTEGDAWQMAPVEIPGLVFRRSVRVEASGVAFTITVEQPGGGETASATQRLVPVGRGEIESIATGCGLVVAEIVSGFDDPSPPAPRASYVLRLEMDTT